MADDEILDPAHVEGDTHVTNAGVAGLSGKGGDDKRPDPGANDRVTPDGNVLERDGKKYITMDAFAAERGKAQRYADALSQLDPLMPEFNEFLQTRNNRRTAVRESVAGQDKDDDAYLSEVATALGYYDETNQPDLRRAQAHLNVTRREAKRESAAAVKPVHESTVRERARTNREAAAGRKFVDGQPIAEQKYLEAALKQLPDELIADDNVANIAQVLAAGFQYLDMRRNGDLGRGRRTREPMLVEGGSGRFEGDDGGLSDFDRAAARARGKSPEAWVKMTKQLNPSRTRNSDILEDV